MNLTRIRRLVQLIGLLQAGKGHNASELSAQCGVSRRTIFRDLDLLRQSGVPVLFDDDHGWYRIPHSYYLPPTNFTPDEALAVLLVCYEIGAANQMPFCGAARGAAIKLESTLPVALREQVRDVTSSVQIRLARTNPLKGSEPVYRQLLRHTARRVAVRMHYDSFTEDSKIATKLCAYRLLFSRHSWYVIGRSSLHREVRTFNVGRILELTPLDETYDVPRGFSIERYLGNAWHLIPEPGTDQEVVVRFNKLVARNVAEVQWHKTQRLEFLPDGQLDFCVTVSGLNEISWWILGYGDQAEVLKPARLRTLIASRAANLAARYEQA